MIGSPIQFHCADVDFTLKRKSLLRAWISETCNNYGKSIHQISFIFCSDEYLLGINQRFLAHDYYTDIITFDNTKKGVLEVEAYISIDRVKDNARELAETFTNELHRVMIHGVLHALGLKDKSPKKAKEMRVAEDQALKRLSQLM